MKILFAVVAILLCPQAAAQGLYKCKDAAGRLTYSDKECSQAGLSSAGEIKGRASVVPADKPSAARLAPPPPPPAAAKDAARDGPRDAAKDGSAPAKDAPVGAEAPAEKERRCFTVQTAKGTATRCNDVPQ